MLRAEVAEIRLEEAHLRIAELRAEPRTLLTIARPGAKEHPAAIAGLESLATSMKPHVNAVAVNPLQRPAVLDIGFMTRLYV